jgi:prevent-host-death family protein
MTVKNSSPTRVQQKLKDILAVLDETGKPYFITQRNRPKAVVIRYDDYSVLVEQARERGPRIIRRPEISGGEPIIQGTRISVRHIVERVRAGQSADDILAALPHLTAAQV